jgi:hypothetical protein
MEAKMKGKTYQELKAELDALRPEDVPDAPSKAGIARRHYEEAKRHNCQVLKMTPYGGLLGRKWQPYVDGPTAYRQVEPTTVEKEIMIAVGEAARQRRAWALDNPMGSYGESLAIGLPHAGLANGLAIRIPAMLMVWARHCFVPGLVPRPLVSGQTASAGLFYSWPSARGAPAFCPR